MSDQHIHPDLRALPQIEDLDQLMRANPVGRVAGVYARAGLDVFWCLRPGLDPLPLDPEQLRVALMTMDAGGAVVVVGTEQVAVDLVVFTLEMTAAGGHA